MHWDITHCGKQTVGQPLTDFPAGLLHGYGVYTTFKLPLTEPWLIKHLERLEQHARAIGLDWPYSQTELMACMVAHYQPDYPVCRLTALPEVAGYGDFYRSDTYPTRLVLSLREATTPQEALSLHSVRYQRPFATLKLNAMADLILLKRQARQAGFEDILLTNEHGNVSEASTANIFFICQGELITPNPEQDHCLPGITRLRIVAAAQQLGISCREASISPEHIARMDGAFLTNAAQGVIPITRIDQHIYPWPDVTQDLLNTLNRRLQQDER